MIMGDFNYPHIDFINGTVAAADDDDSTVFFNKTQELCLFQHVTEITRIRQNQRPSKLDYVFTDEEDDVEGMVCEEPLGKSDHVILIWELLVATINITMKEIRPNYYRGNYESIRTHFLTVNWEQRWKDMTVEEMWADLVKIINEQVSQHVPTRNDQRHIKFHHVSKKK